MAKSSTAAVKAFFLTDSIPFSMAGAEEYISLFPITSPFAALSTKRGRSVLCGLALVSSVIQSIRADGLNGVPYALLLVIEVAGQNHLMISSFQVLHELSITGLLDFEFSRHKASLPSRTRRRAPSARLELTCSTHTAVL